MARINLYGWHALVACERSEIERIQNEKTKQTTVDYGDLEFGTDGLWRKVGAAKPFTSTAIRKHRMENWIGKLTLKEEDQLEEFENGIPDGNPHLAQMIDLGLAYQHPNSGAN